MSLRVFDRSFALIAARSATQAELVESEALDENTVAAYQTVANEILIKWTGSTCAEDGQPVHRARHHEVIIAPTETAACDSTASIRGVVLDFKLGVDLKAIQLRHPARLIHITLVARSSRTWQNGANANKVLTLQWSSEHI